MKVIFLFLMLLWGKALFGQKFGVYSDKVLTTAIELYDRDSVRLEITLINEDTQAVFFPTYAPVSKVIRHEVFPVDSTISIRVGAVSRVGGMPYHWNLSLQMIKPQDSLRFVTVPILRAEWKVYSIGIDFITYDNLKKAKGFADDSKVIPESIEGSIYIKHAHFCRSYFSFQ